MASPVKSRRKRASSLQQVLNALPDPVASDHHLSSRTTLTNPPVSPIASHFPSAASLPREGFFKELINFKWMIHPGTSIKMIAFVLAAWLGWAALIPAPNPFSHLVIISYPLPLALNESRTHYGKGVQDVAFLAFYVVVWSFVRQTVTEYILKPLAIYAGIRKEKKLQRFMEQSYTVFYMTMAGSFGLYVMRGLPTWWYRTEQFWIDYPHWRLTPELKTYYLLEFAYWLQQMMVLTLRIEAPRSDFRELVIHHLVTLWLVGWSYSINLTRIGVSIFVTMDVSDVFLALAKTLNYTAWQRSSEVTFAIFIGVWTYMRHYLNLKILWSIWSEWDALIPEHTKYFRPSEGIWMIWWMKWQIFVPILLLQMVNLFWYYLIWRVLLRILSGTNGDADVREDGEGSDEEDDDKKDQ